MIGRLILTPIRLALVGLGVAWVADRLLRLLAGGAPPEPIRSLVVIDAPIDGVWDVVVDIERQPLWMREMKAVRVLTPGPLGVGTRGEATVRVLGITTIDPVTVTQFEPPTRFAIRHEGAFTGSGLITLEPGADGTTTILRWEETLIAPALSHVAAASSVWPLQLLSMLSPGTSNAPKLTCFGSGHSVESQQSAGLPSVGHVA